MATWLKGSAIPNAEGYDLYEIVNGEHRLLASSSILEFCLDDLKHGEDALEPGTYQLTVKARGVGFEDSDFSNTIHYVVH